MLLTRTGRAYWSVRVSAKFKVVGLGSWFLNLCIAGKWVFLTMAMGADSAMLGLINASLKIDRQLIRLMF